MKEATKIVLSIIALLLFNAIIGLVDLGMNVIGVVPGAGDVAETASEGVLEVTQTLVNLAGGIIIAAFRR